MKKRNLKPLFDNFYLIANNSTAADNSTDYDGFIKETNKYCKKDGKEGNYTTLVLAINACKESSNCGSVYDYKCDGEDPFRKCNGADNILSGGDKGSCIYRKIGRS